jgi:hypothetical protein
MTIFSSKKIFVRNPGMCFAYLVDEIETHELEEVAIEGRDLSEGVKE